MMGSILRIAAFVLFLFPVVVDQYSVNYAFVLFAAAAALQTRRIHVPDWSILLAMGVYTFIYGISVLADLTGGGGYALRITVSFFAFISVFVFAPIELTERDVHAFKVALVSIALIFAGQALVVFFMVGGNDYGFELKNVVGSQRFGFVQLLALFTLIHMPHSGRFGEATKLVAGFVITAGLLLTFSRASVIALGMVLPLYGVAPFLSRAMWSGSGIRLLARRVAIGFAYTSALFVIIPVTFEYYGQMIVSRYSVPIEQSLMIGNEWSEESTPSVFIREGSEGTRLAIWRAVIKHTLEHPWLGSGYLGSWTLKDVVTGSAHNQYMDVLMRTGFPGMLVYFLVLAQVFLFLWRQDQGLFWGGLAILIYGLFHETFKESQGAFILALLIGMYANHQRSQRQKVIEPVRLAAAS